MTSPADAVPSGDRHDVLIVGAGVIGLACAWSLLRAGRQVTLVDAGRAGRGASHGNCGTITPSHAPPVPMPGLPLQVLRWMLRKDAPFHVNPRWDPALFGWLLRALRRCNRHDFEQAAAIRAGLLKASREILVHWVERDGLDCGFAQTGTIYAFIDRGQFEAFGWHREMLQRLEIECRRLDVDELRGLAPALNDRAIGGYFHPGDAHLRPDRYVAELVRCVRAAGGHIVEDTPVHALHGEGGRVTGVELRDGRVWRAEAVLLAAGSWSPSLLKPLGVRLPLQPGKGYSITYDRPLLAPAIPLVLKERSVCVTAWADGFRLGSTMEFSGYDSSLNRVRLDALVRAAHEYLREPEGPVRREEWCGWRPMTPDDLPVIGPVSNHPGLWLATGHGMLGVTLSAVTGELVAAQMTGRVPPWNARPLSPDRFV